ncbi:kinesin-like protein KIN-6 isoform X2 [Phragmites australis]|uniref:kinesin-like protein KIN-6 isoform X2 n=1 Tax=Phragmites australis TaxID=29695 RepID=UPI002D775568|nr:kinesin-like protein KIN-6 isoform X2 [Phragmites australis]
MESPSPLPPTTLRRNPPRRARPPPTPLASANPKPSSLSRLLDDEAASIPLPHPPGPAATTTIVTPFSSSSQEECLKVFLRIRPLPDRDRCKVVSRPMAAKDPRRKPKQAGGGGVCLVATGANSVALTVPQSKLVDPKRGRTEVFDGFSTVLSPDSSQRDIFDQVMNPLVEDFLGGKNGLLVAMGPTGSGKTHTIFGSPRNPGILPLTLRQIFNAEDESKVGKQLTRSFSLSIFEILSEGKGEHILDLLSDAAECILQQSTVKGLQEVAISNFADAESLVARGMLKRSTAATNANSKSSRSQCIITIRAVHKSIGVENEHSRSSAVLTIADLAGAERERRTGNQGSRLLESNFINNTSMVFGLCLRSLLEHQKNQKKPLEKHFKNSMLTRYLRDYLEGRKKMTLILNVKPGDEDYLDTSFLLRQASPYMKIKYTSLEDPSDLVSQKRSNVSLICQEKKKKRRVHKPEVIVVERKEDIDTDNIIKVSERDEAQHKLPNSELRRVSRSEEIMTNFARALWTVLKQYKHKLLESENAAESMKELIRDKDIQIMELKKVLEVLKSCCSCKNFPIVGDTSDEQDDAVSSGQAAQSFVSLSNKPDLGSCDAAVDNFHLVVEEVSEEFICRGPEYSSAHCGPKGEYDNCDASAISLMDEEELSSRDFKPEKSCGPDAFGPKFDTEKGNTEVDVQVVHKELDRPGSFTEEISAHTSGVTSASNHSDNPSDQSLTEHHTLPCLETERASLSPHFTICSKKATIEQCEEETEELSKITIKDIQHDINTRELKDPDPLSSSQQMNSDTEDVSSSQSSVELQGMVASQKKPEELDPGSERCEPAVEESIVEYGTCSCQPPDQMNDHGSMLPCLAKEITSPAKASTAPSKDSEAEEIADEKKDPFAWRPRATKKTTRRLQPVAAMMLKEFTGADMDADIKREERGKSSSSETSGKSDALIQLLKGRAVEVEHRVGS